MSLLAELIAKREGFYVEGSIPQRFHNPGDLRHSPHSSHDPSTPNAIGQIDTDADGWTDLDRQLQLFADRGLTLGQMVAIYAPAADNNDTAGYIAYLCAGLNCTPDTLIKDLLAPPPQISPKAATVTQGVFMSTPNPVLTAAKPALIAILQAVEQFIANMGTDPLQLAVKFPGAVQVLLGTVEMQLPVVATAELVAVQTAPNARIAALIASLQAP